VSNLTFDDRAGVQRDPLICNSCEGLQLMRDDNQRSATIPQLSEKFRHHRNRLDVDVRKGFVQQKQLRQGEHRARQRQPLFHSLRIFTDAPLYIYLCESNLFKQFVRTRAARRGIESAKVVEVLSCRKLVVEERRMCHVANASAHSAHILTTENANTATRGPREPDNDSQQRRFTGAVLAEQAIYASRGQRDAHVVKGSESSKELAYAFKDYRRLRIRSTKAGCFGMGMRSGMGFGIRQSSVGILTCWSRLAGCFGRGRLVRRWCVLRRAFGLNLLGVKDAIGAVVSPYDKSLGIVLERIRRRLSASIGNLKFQALFIDLEIGACALSANATWNHKSGDAEPFRVRLVTHSLQLFNGDVVALALLNPGKREIRHRTNDHNDRDTKTDVSTGRRHLSRVFRR